MVSPYYLEEKGVGMENFIPFAQHLFCGFQQEMDEDISNFALLRWREEAAHGKGD